MDEIRINNLDQMDQYANQLHHKSEELSRLMNQISFEAQQSLQNWNDRSSQNFMSQLDEQKKLINGIAQEMQSFANFVHRKVAKAREASRD